jgi:RND family efflux transporter MFP subunit
MLKRSLFFLVILAPLAAGGYYGLGLLKDTVKVEPPHLVAVRKGAFVHEVLERGSVDSARNVEIRCQVETAGGLIVTFVVPEGTVVKEGDLLVILDSSTLKENVVKQSMAVAASEAKLVKSEADLKNAKLTLTEYLEGKLEQERKTIEMEIFAASEQVSTQEDQFIFHKRFLDRGYMTEAQLKSVFTDLEKARLAEDNAKLKLKILEEYSKEKYITQHEVQIITAEAQVKSDKQSLQLDNDRLTHLEKQLERCEILAPRDGQIVYFTPPRWGSESDIMREGKKVVEREILLLLPDPTQMQVKGLVNEANVRLVKPGQKATIRLEAFPNQVFDGVVRMVSDLPEPAAWGGGGSMSREYTTTVTLLNPPVGVKTGLTAEAKIVVNKIEDALLLPMQAVFKHGGIMYALTYEEGKWKEIEVKTGPANDTEVVILDGLKEGDKVVLGARAHQDKVNLPKVENKPEPEEYDSRDEPPFGPYGQYDDPRFRPENPDRREGPGGGQNPGGGGGRRERPSSDPFPVPSDGSNNPPQRRPGGEVPGGGFPQGGGGGGGFPQGGGPRQ